MKNLQAVETDVMTDYGFFVVKTECGKSLNICLEQRKDGEGFKKEIDGDGGFDGGTCGDANGEAIEQYGSSEVLEFMLREARKAGIKTI